MWVLWVAVWLCPADSDASPFRFTDWTTASLDQDVPIAQSRAEHSDVLAAGFGFQAADSSMITVRTYHAQTGAVLSEDSFELNVKEEGVSEHDNNKGRIFAGGIGVDGAGAPKFILRVYDAETGRFLWEGQLNLLKEGQGGMTKTTATLIPRQPSAVRIGGQKEKPLQTLYSVRAVNPSTGGVVWQDQFVPGNKKKVKAAAVVDESRVAPRAGEPIGHVFDLVVKTYERASGKLLWQDSFEELDHIDEPTVEPDSEPHPQTLPLWNSTSPRGVESHQTSLR
ncbi:MAG: PQQ-binding-like beta-propeller repeat protein [Nitrospiraceae bacterium]|nr:PQQ-binding-like beta-propeller repeat protein [Nitrospiraceae bacterium]